MQRPQLVADKVILVELSDSEFITEVVGSDKQIKGFKPHRIISHESKVVAHYDRETDKTPIDYLLNKEGHFLVTVAAPDKFVNEHHWVWWEMGQSLDNNAVYLKKGPLKATEEETALLDDLFKTYRENAY